MRRCWNRNGLPDPCLMVLWDPGPVGMELCPKERPLCCCYKGVGRALEIISSRGF